MKPLHLLRVLGLCWLCFGIPEAFCTTNALFPESDVRSLALGNNHSHNQLLNPAFISFRNRKELGIATQNRFGIKELSTHWAYISLPNPFLDVAGRFSSFGFSDYRINRLDFNGAKKLHQSLAIGISLHYGQTNSFLEEENSNAYGADIGLFLQLSPKISAGINSKQLISSQSEDRSFLFLGTGYQPTEECLLLMECVLEDFRYHHLSWGVEYTILQTIVARLGIRSDVSAPSLGASYRLSAWRIDAAFSRHPTLGTSSALGIAYLF